MERVRRGTWGTFLAILSEEVRDLADQFHARRFEYLTHFGALAPSLAVSGCLPDGQVQATARSRRREGGKP